MEFTLVLMENTLVLMENTLVLGHLIAMFTVVYSKGK
jgi:hypothetical protein